MLQLILLLLELKKKVMGCFRIYSLKMDLSVVGSVWS